MSPEMVKGLAPGRHSQILRKSADSALHGDLRSNSDIDLLVEYVAGAQVGM